MSKKPLTVADIRKAMEQLKQYETPQTFVAAPWLVEKAKEYGVPPQVLVDALLEFETEQPTTQPEAPTPDTSPGDELQLEKALIDLYESAMLHGEAQANGVLPTQSQREQTVIVAKDRLNRLMLTRERERLEKLKEKQFWAADDAYDAGDVVSVADIDDEVKAIDAQLNKEETDGDVPTHSEPSKP